jgi:hypothetical protein
MIENTRKMNQNKKKKSDKTKKEQKFSFFPMLCDGKIHDKNNIVTFLMQ